MRHIDLSHDIFDKMTVYPGDSDVSVHQEKYLGTDDYNNFKLEIGTHVGTHVDSPMHMTKNTKYIGEISVERFCGNAKVFDVRNRMVICLSDMDFSLVKENDIVLFYTGFDDKYGTDQYYFEHPVLSLGVAEELVKKKVKLVGVDMPSPDKYPFEIHKLLFNSGIFIVENLRNLNSILGYQNIEVYMFPLKIKADASMVRAVAKVE